MLTIKLKSNWVTTFAQRLIGARAGSGFWVGTFILGSARMERPLDLVVCKDCNNSCRILGSFLYARVLLARRGGSGDDF